jgi:hypothetical protein
MFDGFEKKFYEDYKTIGVPDDVIERSMAYGESRCQTHHGVCEQGFVQANTRIQAHCYQRRRHVGADAPGLHGSRRAQMDENSLLGDGHLLAIYAAEGHPVQHDERAVLSINWPTKCINLAYIRPKSSGKLLFSGTITRFVMNVAGHVSYASKKMTPGGHWLAIAATVSRQKKANFAQTVFRLIP